MALVPVLNLLIIIVIIILSIILFRMNSKILNNITTLSNNIDVKKVVIMEETTTINQTIGFIDNRLKYAYITENYNYKLPDFFLSDIYKDLPPEQQVESVQNDYLVLFILAINSIVNNKQDFIKYFKKLNQPVSLQLQSYIPVVKLAKYSIDYNKYLVKMDTQKFLLLVETYYPQFNTNPKYFIEVANNSCQRNEQVLFFVTLAISLYTKHRDKVNDCIYYNKCSCASPVVQEEVCNIIPEEPETDVCEILT